MKKKKDEPAPSDAELRTDVRIATDIERMVEGCDDKFERWQELTTPHNISKSGAGFTLSRPCMVGRLVKLTSPMSKEMHELAGTDEPHTAVGLVQYCQPSKPGHGEGYDVGVAFAGEEFPESYFIDPGQSYRITGRDETGMWAITEATFEFVTRAAPRFAVQVDITISMMQKDRQTARYKEKTFTYDVSVSGACVAATLRVGIGDRLKFAVEEHKFYAIAVVRGRSRKFDLPALHLEFVDAKYPVEKLTPTTPDYPEPEPDETPE
jgi:hypothetical protein